ncbi:hypothetical protein AF65_05550 [Streptococcus uberis C5388]|nr:hypothetical protein AF64_05480 [Streptococcus uberis C9359]KKF53468.1 hypothetical protein AF65_05550 [Streptococcus uberis C5388]KKF61646.1 hypothetical protein AF58_08250 [Streptococcus uberis C6344]
MAKSDSNIPYQKKAFRIKDGQAGGRSSCEVAFPLPL